MNAKLLIKIQLVLVVALLSLSASADLQLTSPVMENGGMLPSDLKCTRDGGDGLSPPINWSGVPAGTKSFAVIMHHYPQGRVEGVDLPSHYWLLWNVPAETKSLPRGNPESIGNEGGDKDKRYIGYTPPCSPGNVTHSYTITLYALDTESLVLGNEDDIDVDWAALTGAIDGHILASSALTFNN